MSQPQENQISALEHQKLSAFNQTMQVYPPTPEFLSKEEIELLKKTILAKFSGDEQESFIRICQRARLDPFTKQIYPTVRYSKVRQPDGSTKKVPGLVPVTGIMGLTAVGTRTGKYDGCEITWSGKDGHWREEWLEVDPPEAAKCKVFHKDRSHPEVCIARWGGFVGQQYDYDSKSWYVTDFWNKMPDFMLAKCAKAGALRGAFPDQLSGLYIGEELESGITEEVSESIPEEEDHYRKARQAEAALVAAHPEQLVTPAKPAPQLSPAEALEPALEQDKVPPRPAQPMAKPATQPSTAPSLAEAGPPDELDLSPSPLASPWKEHIIRGITNKKFYGRKLGSLNALELGALETQWLPKARAKWDEATDEQQEDARQIEAAVAYYKMEPPR